MNTHLFENKTYERERIVVNDFKLPILRNVLICTLMTVLLIEANVLKYLDPGSGSLLIQTMIFGLTSCSICGIPLAIIGGVVYFLTKNRKKNTLDSR